MSISRSIMGQAANSYVAPTYIEDVFSTYLYTGNGSTQRIFNGINLGQKPADDVHFHMSGTTSTDQGPFGYSVTAIGNATTSATQTKFTSSSLYLDGSGDGDDSTSFKIDPGQLYLGKKDFTIEYWAYYPSVLPTYIDLASWNYYYGTGTFGFGLAAAENTRISLVGYTSQGVTGLVKATNLSLSTGTWYHVAVSRRNGVAYIFLDGKLKSIGDFDVDLTDVYTGGVTLGRIGGFGAVQGYYSDYRITIGKARYLTDFDVPTSALPFDSLQDGDGGMVWTKSRSSTNYHEITDTDRGPNEYLTPNTNDASNPSNQTEHVKAFNSDGFTVGSETDVNGSGLDMASWTFRKAPRFFDTVTYTGTGSSQTISHNLGIEPGCIIFKYYDGGTPDFLGWYIYHRSLGVTQALGFTNSPAFTANLITSASSTDFVINDPSDRINESGTNYVAYLFAHDPLGPSGDGSDGLIACGSYTGNGSSTGPEIDLGWEPQWIMLKDTTNSGGVNWVLMDNMRGLNYTDVQSFYPNTSTEETDWNAGVIRPTATGFNVRTTNGYFNDNGHDYIYIAIRRGPMRVPTSGTEVFNVDFQTATSPAFTTGNNLPIDAAIRADTDGAEHRFGARLTSGKLMYTTGTNAEISDSTWRWDYMNGFRENPLASDSTRIAWMFRRAPSFFDVVCYDGTGSGGEQIPHSLGVAPELAIVKCRTSSAPGDTPANWAVYHKDFGADARDYLFLNKTDATATTLSIWQNGNTVDNMGETYFELGNDDTVNRTGFGYIAYLFASLDGVSKVGSYTGTGAIQTIDCGFTSGARFVLIKRTDSTSPWWLWDTARGIVSGTEPFFDINSTAGHTTNFDWLDPASVGFELPAGGNNNLSGASYIFLAIA